MALPDDVLAPALVALVVVTFTVSAFVLRRIDPEVEQFLGAIRPRFLYGVPWGTIVTISVVLAVYLFVQGGWSDWHDPVTIPFRAWSYAYPTGMLLGGLAHNSSGHLIGNLTGTIVLAPLAEFVWGHYPQGRGRDRTDHSLARFPFDGDPGEAVNSDRSLLARPWVRAVVVFPTVVIGVAVGTTLFALGPVIGFSGAVFALGGFALVRYPMTTIVLLSASRGVSIVYNALTDPVVTAGTSASPPSPPSWATIAIQGHALGILTGVLLGLLLLRARNRTPPAGRLWVATFLYATAQGLWAVYWFLGDGEYVLYRGVGVVLVAVLALLIVGAAAAPTRRWFPDADDETLAAASWRSVTLVAVLLGLTLIAAPSLVPNLATPGEDAVPNDRSVTVADYEITYAESARNRMIPAVPLPYLDEQTNVSTSGVVVISEQRGIWTQSISRQRLAFSGQDSTAVGGIGWRADVTATRKGWTVVGNDTVYTVALAVDDEDPTAVFAAENATAEPRVANRSVRIDAVNDQFYVTVLSGGDPIDRVSLPEANDTVTAGGLELVAQRDSKNSRTKLYVERNGTRVRVAAEETYR